MKKITLLFVLFTVLACKKDPPQPFNFTIHSLDDPEIKIISLGITLSDADGRVVYVENRAVPDDPKGISELFPLKFIANQEQTADQRFDITCVYRMDRPPFDRAYTWLDVESGATLGYLEVPAADLATLNRNALELKITNTPTNTVAEIVNGDSGQKSQEITPNFLLLTGDTYTAGKGMLTAFYAPGSADPRLYWIPWTGTATLISNTIDYAQTTANYPVAGVNTPRQGIWASNASAVWDKDRNGLWMYVKRPNGSLVTGTALTFPDLPELNPPFYHFQAADTALLIDYMFEKGKYQLPGDYLEPTNFQIGFFSTQPRISVESNGSGDMVSVRLIEPISEHVWTIIGPPERLKNYRLVDYPQEFLNRAFHAYQPEGPVLVSAYSFENYTKYNDLWANTDFSEFFWRAKARMIRVTKTY